MPRIVTVNPGQEKIPQNQKKIKVTEDININDYITPESLKETIKTQKKLIGIMRKKIIKSRNILIQIKDDLSLDIKIPSIE